jgi:hypothetical protein
VIVGAAAKAAPNSFAARVVHVAFLGDLIRLTLHLSENSGTTLQADVLRASLQDLPCVGDIVHAALPARHLLLLGGDV